MKTKREVEVLVLSDIHLGTYGCHAKELVRYLRTVQPKKIILNGDIIDIWQFSKWYWPKSHMKVIKELIKLLSNGIPIYYITGNHDDTLRKFTDFSLTNFHLIDKMVLTVGNRKAWVFHGDVFDVSIKYTKWLAKLGGKSYELLIVINSILNWFLAKLGKPKYSFSKRIKNSVKNAVKFIDDFESTAAELGIKNKFDFVICGHIHQPQNKTITTSKGSIQYLNSGDWIENLTALEFYDNQWHIYKYSEEEIDTDEEMEEVNIKDLKSAILNALAV